MKCNNCGAPLPKHSTKCDYCGAINDIDLNIISDYTTEELDSGRTCPNCNVYMETIDIKLNGKFLIEHCSKCNALFFDLNELETILDSFMRNQYNVDYLLLNNISRENHIDYESKITYKKCPVCQKLMNRVNFGFQSGVVIDRCKEHGIFLDNGKLHALIQWVKAGGAIYHKEVTTRIKKEKENERRKKEIKNKEFKINGSTNNYKNTNNGFSHYSSKLKEKDPQLFSTILNVINRFF